MISAKRKLLLIVAGIIFWATAFSQNINLDSLKSIISSQSNDSIRLAAFNSMIVYYFSNDLNEAKIKSDDMLLMARRVKNPYYEATALKWLGSYHFMKSDFANAMDYYLQALRVMDAQGMKAESAGVLHNVGNIHVRWFHPKEALEYFYRAMAINTETGNTRWLVNNLISIGITHHDLLKQNDSALKYLRQAEAVSIETGQVFGLYSSLLNLAVVFIDLKDEAHAEAALLRCITIAEEHNLNQNLARVYEKLGLITHARNKVDSAIYWYQKAYDLQNSTQQSELRFGLGVNMASAYADKREFQKAYELILEAYSLRDSIYSEREKGRIADLEAQYILENKNRELELAHKDRIIAKQNNSILLGIILALMLFASLIYIAYRQNRKNLALLALKNNEISDTNNLLAQSNQKLNDLVTEKNNILSIVAHDVRAPLAKIRARSDIMKLDETLPENHRVKLQDIDSELSATSGLIEQLLDAQRNEAVGIELEISEFTPAEVVREIVSNYSANARIKRLKIELETDESKFLTDALRFRRITDNLLSNAIKYSPEASEVQVKLWYDGDFMHLMIKDEGPGFSEEDKAKMFRKFTRLSAQPVGGGSSHGLGLSIVKRIAEELRGEITLDSEEGKGAEFIVKIPAKPLA